MGGAAKIGGVLSKVHLGVKLGGGAPKSPREGPDEGHAGAKKMSVKKTPSKEDDVENEAAPKGKAKAKGKAQASPSKAKSPKPEEEPESEPKHAQTPNPKAPESPA